MGTGKVSPAEGLKAGSGHLRATISDELLNDLTSFSRPSSAILKFHGVYQQDDRDLRKTSPEKVYSSMVRVGLSGGAATAAQYLELDRLADECGDGTLRVTSRQDVQYHYVGKRNLKQLLQSIGGTGLSTWGACGDVVRNVTYDSTPLERDAASGLLEVAQRIRKALHPKSAAYAEIWMDGEKAASLEAEADEVYGETYLPRKFKIGIAYEGENLIDVYSNDLGFVAHFDGGKLAGFTIMAGGGMGQANGVKGSHPRLADVIGFVGPDEAEMMEVSKAVVGIHREFGNRENRKLARLKYVLDERGVAWFKEELERRLGRPLAPARELKWTREDDYLGWQKQSGGKLFYGLRVVSGRLKGGMRAAVREAVLATGCEVRFTVQQNLLLCGIAGEQQALVEQILRKHGVVEAAELPPVLRHSMACVSLPTCGQAITEAERVFPDVAAALQKELDAAGAAGTVVHVRMTGCPNGCVRPYTAEIGIVGESVGLYTIYMGGSPRGDRLATVWKKLVPLGELGVTLRPEFDRYVAERSEGETFGDWWARG